MRILLTNKNSVNLPTSYRLAIAFLLFSIFLAVQIANIFFYGVNLGGLLWYCEVALVFLAIAYWRQSALIASTILVTAIPAQFLWIMDFFLNSFFGFSFGRTEWMFDPTAPLIIPALSTVVHFVVIPGSTYAVWLFGFSKSSLRVALLATPILLIATFLLTDPVLNRNCVFFPCDLHMTKDATFILQYSPPFFSVWYLLYNIVFWMTTITLSFKIIKPTIKRVAPKIKHIP